jgi:hypothetical protein
MALFHPANHQKGQSPCKEVMAAFIGGRKQDPLKKTRGIFERDKGHAAFFDRHKFFFRYEVSRGRNGVSFQIRKRGRVGGNDGVSIAAFLSALPEDLRYPA